MFFLKKGKIQLDCMRKKSTCQYTKNRQQQSYGYVAYFHCQLHLLPYTNPRWNMQNEIKNKTIKRKEIKTGSKQESEAGRGTQMNGESYQTKHCEEAAFAGCAFDWRIN